MLKSLNALLFVLITFVSYSHELKQIERSELYKSNSVDELIVKNVHFENNEPVDTFLVEKWSFDDMGRPVRFGKYFAGGKEHSWQTFEYDELGNLTKNIIAHRFNNWEEEEFLLEKDESGMLISRSLKKGIPNWGQKEMYHYDEHGSLIRATQYHKQNDEWIVLDKQDFDSIDFEEQLRTRNTLTKVFDQNGLQLMHLVRDDQRIFYKTLFSYIYEGNSNPDINIDTLSVEDQPALETNDSHPPKKKKKKRKRKKRKKESAIE